MKSVLPIVMLLAAAIAVVVYSFSVTITIYHIFATPFVVFSMLAIITTVDKVIFLNWTRGDDLNETMEQGMTKEEMVKKFSVPSDSKPYNKPQLVMPSRLSVLVCLCLLMFSLSLVLLLPHY